MNKGFKKGHLTSIETRIKIGNANRKSIKFNCDSCNRICFTKPSAYKKKKRHFCSNECYYYFRKNKLPISEQNAFKGIRKDNESKQIYHKRYCENNIEKIRHLKSLRYAREKGADGKHTLKEWNRLKDKFDNKCVLCKEVKTLTKDHIIPLSLGGNNFIKNIQPLCRNCNSKKWKFIYQNPELLESK